MEIRALGWSGKAAQAGDLAEIFHETPMEMWGWGGWDPDFLRQRLVQYQAKYHGDWYEGRRDYVKMLDEILGAPPDSQAR